MLKKTRKLFHVILIALVASLTLAPAAQAAYDYKMTVTVDRSRVAPSAMSPPAGFGFMKCITIDNAKVSGTSNLTAFPVLVSIQNDAALKTTANGGQVTDDQGDDLVFYAPDLTTRLESEVERYDGTAGTLIAWVRLPELKHDVDTVFYLAYGNDTIDDPLGVASAVWDSDFKGVWHMQEEAAGTGNTDVYQDSTANANHGDDEVSNTGQDGKIGSGQGFDGNNDQVNFGSDPSLNIRDAVTMSAWIKLSTRPGKDDWYNIHTKGDATYQMYIQGVGKDRTTLGAYFELDTGNKDLWDLTSIDIDPADGWAHVAVTFDGTDVKFYVNGVLDHTENEPGTIDDSAGLDFVYADAEKNWFHGFVDEIRLSSTDRSADWIATEYNNQDNPGGFMTIEDARPLTDFPVLISIQNDAQLKHTDYGGQVTDAQGDDIIFTTDASGLSPLNHEVESYDGTTGTLAAWVRLPSLVASEDTVFFLHYGNSAVSSPQGGATAVWDANYKGVWHLDEEQSGTGATDLYTDSTVNGNHGDDQVSATGQNGMIAAGQQFDGNNDYVGMGDVLDYGKNDPMTYSAWIKTNGTMMQIAGKANQTSW